MRETPFSHIMIVEDAWFIHHKALSKVSIGKTEHLQRHKHLIQQIQVKLDTS